MAAFVRSEEKFIGYRKSRAANMAYHIDQFVHIEESWRNKTVIDTYTVLILCVQDTTNEKMLGSTGDSP